MALPVKVKHNGKVHDVQLDTSQPATAFKQAIHNVTGVPPERQKVMIKGGMLKDDSDLSKIGARAGQTFMVIGTAGELPKAPTGPVTFIEDMTDSQLAMAVRTKAGLTNLGNTCYLNSTLQVMRAIPELQVALNRFTGNMGGIDGDSNLTAALRDLYGDLGKTTESFPPLAFLTILRQVAPQFAEMVRGGGGYAQQDAEEVWVRIISALQATLKGLPPSADSSAADNQARKFVEQFMTGHMVIKRSCPEAPNEPPSFQKEPFLLMQCNISNTTNEMTSGMLDSLNQKIEKQSESLGRTAVYEEVSRVDRLPAYLTTHFVRFYWRRDINKKTKIMRKVKFPFDLDMTPFVTDELKSKISASNSKIKAVEKERDERSKIRRKARARREEALKSDAAQSTDPSNLASASSGGVDAPRPAGDMAVDTTEDRAGPASTGAMATTAGPAGEAVSEEEELKIREDEARQVRESIHPDLASDLGANNSGLYELVGIVTHKGAAADAGHYISWVRKDHESDSSGAIKALDTSTEKEWYKFDDDKVSVVPKEKITTLDGGGEDSVAYILLYRSKKIE